MDKPNWLLDIPSEEYHKATKDVEYISSHRLSIFRRCPLEYHKHITGEIPEGDTTTFLQGRMAHTLVLEGAEKFLEEYLVASGPVNPKTDAPFGPTSKAYLDWAAAQAKPIVSPDEFAVFGKMSTAVRAHDKAKELLSAGFSEGTIRAEWNGVPVQGRMDWYDPERNIIVDLKTCRDLDRFSFDIRDYGYIFQLAFYAKIVSLLNGGNVPACWLVAVEKGEPFRCGVFSLLPFTVEEANSGCSPKMGLGNELCLEQLKRCQETDVWPTRYEGFATI